MRFPSAVSAVSVDFHEHPGFCMHEIIGAIISNSAFLQLKTYRHGLKRHFKASRSQTSKKLALPNNRIRTARFGTLRMQANKRRLSILCCIIARAHREIHIRIFCTFFGPPVTAKIERDERKRAFFALFDPSPAPLGAHRPGVHSVFQLFD